MNHTTRTLLAGFLLAPLAAFAADYPAATVSLLTGESTASSDSGIRELAKGDAVFTGEIVHAAVNSYLNLKFSDGGYVLLRPNSRMQIDDYRYVQPETAAAAPPPPPPAPVPLVPENPGGTCKPLDISGCRVGNTVLLSGVSFPPGSTALTPQGKTALDILANALKRSPETRVEIGGHSDASGSPQANRKVSEQRADMVKIYLMNRGVDGTRLVTHGYGQSRPIADNSTEAGRNRNRRFELKILSTSRATEAAVAAEAAAKQPGANTPKAPAVSQQPGESRAYLSLIKGGFRAVSGAIGKINHDDYRISTPVITLGIRGTDYLAVICDETCAFDPAIAASVPPGKSARGGLVTTVYKGAIVIGNPPGGCDASPAACTPLSAGQVNLTLTDGSQIRLPAPPRFLAVDPLPDPAACGG